jgi:hypothetical protein
MSDLEKAVNRLKEATERSLDDQEFLGALLIYFMRKHHDTQFGVLAGEIEEIRKAQQIKIQRTPPATNAFYEKITVYAEPKPTEFKAFADEIKKPSAVEHFGTGGGLTGRPTSPHFLPAIDPNVV